MLGNAETPSEPVGNRAEDESYVTLPPELLAAIPEDGREEFSRKFGQFFVEVRREEHYSGPLPPYEEAAGWNELVPGFAEQSFDLYLKRETQRIEALDLMLASFEKSVHHEIKLEAQQHQDSVNLTRTVVSAIASRERRG